MREVGSGCEGVGYIDKTTENNKAAFQDKISTTSTAGLYTHIPERPSPHTHTPTHTHTHTQSIAYPGIAWTDAEVTERGFKEVVLRSILEQCVSERVDANLNNVCVHTVRYAFIISMAVDSLLQTVQLPSYSSAWWLTCEPPSVELCLKTCSSREVRSQLPIQYIHDCTSVY